MTGGRAVKAAASLALYGTEAEIEVFLTQTLPKATAEDNRVAVATYLAKSGTGLRREAVAALNDGDSAMATFLRGGFKTALLRTCAWPRPRSREPVEGQSNAKPPPPWTPTR